MFGPPMGTHREAAASKAYGEHTRASAILIKDPQSWFVSLLKWKDDCAVEPGDWQTEPTSFSLVNKNEVVGDPELRPKMGSTTLREPWEATVEVTSDFVSDL